ARLDLRVGLVRELVLGLGRARPVDARVEDGEGLAVVVVALHDRADGVEGDEREGDRRVGGEAGGLHDDLHLLALHGRGLREGDVDDGLALLDPAARDRALLQLLDLLGREALGELALRRVARAARATGARGLVGRARGGVGARRARGALRG